MSDDMNDIVRDAIDKAWRTGAEAMRAMILLLLEQRATRYPQTRVAVEDQIISAIKALELP